MFNFMHFNRPLAETLTIALSAGSFVAGDASPSSQVTCGGGQVDSEEHCLLQPDMSWIYNVYFIIAMNVESMKA